MKAITPVNAHDPHLNKQASIIRSVKQQILSGQMQPCDRLPTRQDMVQDFQVSMVTLQRAMDSLKQDGFIVSRGRLGSFVADAPPHLCRYGVVFPGYASVSNRARRHWHHLAPPSRFMDALALAAAKCSRHGERELVCYMGADRELNTLEYRNLVEDIQARRLAGVIFLHPHSAYTPELLEGTGIPGIVYAFEEGLPGAATFHTDLKAFVDQALDFHIGQGRTNIAMLCIAASYHDPEPHFHQAATARGLVTGAHSVIGLDPYYPKWAKNAVAILLNQPPSKRPDGLIITDEHLVPAATQGILEAGVTVPDELAVVAHCNFVADAPSAVFVTRLGFDAISILERCIQVLDAQRRGEKVASVTRIKPVFESQTTAVTASEGGV